MNPIPKRSGLLAAAGALVALGTCAYVIARQSAKAEDENPPQGCFVDVDGIGLHYTEHGDPQAPALVILHGMGSMGLEILLSGLIELAQCQYRVLVFDRPGYGHSTRPAGRDYSPQAQARLFLKAFEQLGIDRPVVMAHSWATLIGIAMAQQDPSKLKGVVLVSGYYTPTMRMDVLLASTPAIPFVGKLLAHTLSPLIARALWPLLSWRIFSPAPDQLRRTFDEDYPKWMTLRPSALRTAAQEVSMMRSQAKQLTRNATALEVPIVIVAGDEDRLVQTDRHSRRLQHLLPNSRLRVVSQTGHMVHHSDPEVLLDAIREVSSMVTPDTPVDLNAAVLAPEDEPYQTSALSVNASLH